VQCGEFQIISYKFQLSAQ